jgi:hypothetical protein
MIPLAFLKKALRRPPELLPGSVVSLGKPKIESVPEGDCLWRVCAIRHYVGIPHAILEQLATGETKTLAVSALLGDRTIHVVGPHGAV